MNKIYSDLFATEYDIFFLRLHFRLWPVELKNPHISHDLQFTTANQEPKEGRINPIHATLRILRLQLPGSESKLLRRFVRKQQKAPAAHASEQTTGEV